MQVVDGGIPNLIVLVDDALQGPRGATGASGTNGTDGTDGAAGPKGDKGDTGDTGPAGPSGSSHSTLVGDGTTVTFSVVHSLNTLAVAFSVRDVSTGEFVYPTVSSVDVNTISVTFALAPTTNQYSVAVVS